MTSSFVAYGITKPERELNRRVKKYFEPRERMDKNELFCVRSYEAEISVDGNEYCGFQCSREEENRKCWVNSVVKDVGFCVTKRSVPGL